jgi:hypothetical protein
MEDVGIFYGHSVVAVSYSLGSLGIFSLVLVCLRQKNLATLQKMAENCFMLFV